MPTSCTYRDAHYFQEHHWHACIVFHEKDGSRAWQTTVHPPDGEGIFATEEDAKDYNRLLFERMMAKK
jgi:hypothetical protein